MSITIVASFISPEIKTLISEAQNSNTLINILNFTSLHDFHKKINDVGDVVFYRNSSLSKNDRYTMLSLLEKEKKIIVNKALLSEPLLFYKSYQQSIASKNSFINSIPTFKVSSIDELKDIIQLGELHYPFLLKPDFGTQGNGIEMIKDESDIEKLNTVDFTKFIFQNFIENDGDYRIIVVGGKPLGILKRIAKDGSFLNNISQGGHGEDYSQAEISGKIFKIASQIASMFDLGVCGVDLIIDKNTKNIYFLEVNVIPQWANELGFTPTTGINVANKIFIYFKELSKRNRKQKISDTVKEYYDQGISILGMNKFHYLSRMYLWTRDDKYHNELLNLKDKYIMSLNSLMTKTINPSNIKSELLGKIVNMSLKRRKPYFDKYPKLKYYLPILFKLLMVKNLFQEDIGKFSSLINITEMNELFNALARDKSGISRLSTHAINFFYLSDFYLKSIGKKSNLDPELFLNISKNYLTNSVEDIKYKIYLLTHCIIGASEFYNKNVKQPIYKEFLNELQDTIINNYFQIILDLKLEFLVCCTLCQWKPKNELERLIRDELSLSLSPIGNFIIDTHNKSVKDRKFSARHNFYTSEHRNVLYIMSQTPRITISSNNN